MIAICGVQLNHGKRSRELLWMLGLDETMDQLAMAVCIDMVMFW